MFSLNHDTQNPFLQMKLSSLRRELHLKGKKIKKRKKEEEKKGKKALNCILPRGHLI